MPDIVKTTIRPLDIIFIKFAIYILSLKNSALTPKNSPKYNFISRDNNEYPQ